MTTASSIPEIDLSGPPQCDSFKGSSTPKKSRTGDWVQSSANNLKSHCPVIDKMNTPRAATIASAVGAREEQ